MYARVANAFKAYLRLAWKHPWLVFLGWVAFSGVMFWIGSSLKVRGDLDDLFPEDTPAVVRAKETRRVLGNTQEIRLIIGSPDQALNRAVAAEMAAFFESRKDEVARIEWRRDVSFFEKNGLLFVAKEDLVELDKQVSEAIQKAVKKDLELDDFGLDEDEKKAAEPKAAGDAKTSELPTIDEVKKKYKVEGFREYFESPDGQVIAVKAFPSFKPSDATRTRALNEAIEVEMKRIIDAHPGSGLEYVMDGDFSQVTKAAKQILGDAASSGIWSLIGIIVVVIAYFRRVRALIAVVVVLVMATTWVIGFAELAIGYLNLVTSIIFAILFGLGVDYLIHGMGRVDEEHHGDVPFQVAVERGLFGLGRPAFNAMATTAATFFSLTFFDFRGFSQLGLIAGVGIALALTGFFVVYPPLAFGMHKIWKQRPRKAIEAETMVHGVTLPMPPVSRGKKRAAWLILGAVLAASIVATVLGLELRFDSDMGRFRTQDNSAESSLKKKYREAESRTASPALVVTKDLEETRRLHHYLDVAVKEAKADAAHARFPRLEEVSSVWSFVPRDQEEKLALVTEIKRKIDNKYGALEGQAKIDADELRHYLSPSVFGPEDLPSWIKEKFTDTEGRFGRYVLLFTSGSKADALTAIDIERQIGTIRLPATATEPEVTLTSSATYYISGEAYSVVKREGPMAALIGFLVVVLVVVIDTRKLANLVRIVVPIVCGFAITVGCMTIFHVPLDLFNVVVLPQIFGIGIDTGIHLNHRLVDGGTRVTKNLLATGAAAGISALLTVVGFAALLPVQNEGLRSIGIVACLGVSLAFVVNAVMYVAFNWLARPVIKDA
ncbi:MAG: MMPL family transporter [Deltaproteobacteria bacterium]|jgi:hypothetical protein|nr:MMPL family transporter [Deltaproteobacteria bacterium]